METLSIDQISDDFTINEWLISYDIASRLGFDFNTLLFRKFNGDVVAFSKIYSKDREGRKVTIGRD